MTNKLHQGRREFIRKAGVSAALAAGLSPIATAAPGDAPLPTISLQKDDVILFQGDSITDAGRNRDQMTANNTRALGNGYAFMAASQLLYGYPEKGLKIFNRGISGNKVYQLAERWEADCLDLKPSVLSILIGVNDFWHMISGRYEGTIATYSTDLKALLARTKEKLPDVRLIIGEPFAVTDVKAVDAAWFPRFAEYQQAAREIAAQFGAVFIPYQSVFDKAAKEVPGAYWTSDGVHPTIAGSQLMAQAWLKSVEG